MPKYKNEVEIMKKEDMHCRIKQQKRKTHKNTKRFDSKRC